MGAILMVTVILSTIALSVALGVAAIAGFISLMGRFIAKDASLTPPPSS